MMTTQYASLRKDHDQQSVYQQYEDHQYASLRNDHLAGDQQSGDHTDKKEKKISLIFKEIQKEGAKPYMSKGIVLYMYMTKYLRSSSYMY